MVGGTLTFRFPVSNGMEACAALKNIHWVAHILSQLKPCGGRIAALQYKLRNAAIRIDAITIGDNPPADINVIVEVSIGGEPIKYELDKDSGALVVDRFLYTPMRYPGNYGFVPHTLSEDGDPIDVLICNTRAIIPGAVINCRPVGVLVMEDDGGEDEKVIAVPSSAISKRYDTISGYNDLPQITLDQIQHFFEHYKDLEPGKWVKIKGWENAESAQRFVAEAIERARRD